MGELFNPIKAGVWATLLKPPTLNIWFLAYFNILGSYIDIKSFNIDQLLGHSPLNHSKKVIPILIYGSSVDFTGCDKT